MTTKIVKLEAQNVKRLQAVEITPDGNVVVIGGKNGQGKTSVLDSIMYALGGKDVICEKPLRDGEEKGMIRVELDDLIVIRTFTAAGGGTLTVTNSDGARYSSPQAMLDKLVGSLTFDPLGFTRMAPKQQLETLRALVGIDFTALDTERKKLFETRTAVNRIVTQLHGQMQGLPQHEDVPEKELVITELVEELRKAEQHNNQREEFLRVEKAGRERMTTIARQIADLEDQIKALQAENNKVVETMHQAAEAAKSMTQIDMEPLRAKLATAEQTNVMIRANAKRNEVAARLAESDAEAKQLTAAIESVDTRKQDALAAAKFPVSGLSFDERGVLLNGLPFGQASSAEQMRVSVAMGIAMNPTLKVMMIRDGSLLDDDSLRLISEIAKENDYQIWIERVGDGAEVSVVIEDGQIRQAKEAEAAA